ncbi:hypothetical protein GCM10007320_43180 [Pseudorhodoferax aquiterrae]|uniref:DUF3306 domain-containing protein n=1 Tax=Pseudorhodoferax aquiterrae TaxID=747304 RepID=A0ABQ3G6B7_9BURK|nr:DUF3306 domain-containing protein [Pseudorhodoferax aquiterrae]GHC92784.1 hypothetical protein GCM10007320_43180 [Pseudorhodoferax aquiterrae]
MAPDSGFLSRWSQRKVQARQGAVLPEAPPPVPTPAPAVTAPATEAPAATPAPAAPPLPTLDDVTQLTRDSDFSRFVAPEVSGEVRNAALKKLFSDPHFNVMDGLDTYIDDYNTPDPLPAAMLRQMAQAAYLGLATPEAETEPARTDPPAAGPQNPPAAAMEPHDEDPDLRLQSLHDPGPPGPGPGAGGHAGGQC